MVVNNILLFLIKHGLRNCLKQTRSMRVWNVFFFVSQMLDCRVSFFLEDVDIMCFMYFQFCIDCIVRLLSFSSAFFVYAIPFVIFITIFIVISFFLVLCIVLAFLVIMEIYRFIVDRLKIFIVVETQHFSIVIFDLFNRCFYFGFGFLIFLGLIYKRV